MKILDRYVIREYLKLLLLLMVSIISIYLIIDFFGKIRMFISNNATVTQMAAHFFYMIPTIVSQTTPAVILLATLMTFGAMSKHNEIVAVKANGVSQDFSFVIKQRGMFSYTGLSAEQVARMQSEFGVYAVNTGRVCIAALNSKNIDYVAKAIAAVL